MTVRTGPPKTVLGRRFSAFPWLPRDKGGNSWGCSGPRVRDRSRRHPQLSVRYCRARTKQKRRRNAPDLEPRRENALLSCERGQEPKRVMEGTGHRQSAFPCDDGSGGCPCAAVQVCLSPSTPAPGIAQFINLPIPRGAKVEVSLRETPEVEDEDEERINLNASRQRCSIQSGIHSFDIIQLCALQVTFSSL